MRRTPIVCMLVLSPQLVLGLIDSTRAADRRPNVLVFLADDLGYGELSCQGNPQIPTPHIDAIATGGVRFTDGYVSASYCAESRAGILTGRYQTRFGFESNPVGARNEERGIGLPSAEITLAELLQDAGYATGLVGKWHLGGTAPFHPQRHGFDSFFGFLHEGHYYVPSPYKGVVTWLRRRTLPTGAREGRWSSADGNLILSAHLRNNEPDYDANNPILRDGQPVLENEYLTDALTREAVDFIDRHHERPFFLLVAYNAVHSPMQAKPDDMAEFAHIEDVHRRIFAGMLRSLDDSVGAVTGKVRELGLEETTLVFFLSDNGGPTRELTSSNAPLRDGKGSVYDGGLRVPFLVQWKGTLPAGRVCDEPVVSLDIYSTAAAVADVPVGSDQKIDGVNLLPHLTGQRTDPAHGAIFWRMGDRAALRQGDWKIVRPRGSGTQAWELYNLDNDLAENNNLAAAQPETLQNLIQRWNELNAQMAEARF